MNILNIAGYRFVKLDNLLNLKEAMLTECYRLELKGTILVSEEGINVSLAGEEQQIATFCQYLEEMPSFAGMWYHRTWTEDNPFKRMLIKIRDEIIRMDCPEIDPLEEPAPRLSPQEFKQWLDEGREVLVLDTRNDYEIKLGTFDNAVDLDLDTFREFPDKLDQLDDKWRDLPVITFCTGGVRCEKAAPLMEKQGFNSVYQLDGGILNYFKQCGDAHYHGECFVFDERVAVNTDLNETDTILCENCQKSISPLLYHVKKQGKFGHTCEDCSSSY